MYPILHGRWIKALVYGLCMNTWLPDSLHFGIDAEGASWVLMHSAQSTPLQPGQSLQCALHPPGRQLFFVLQRGPLSLSASLLICSLPGRAPQPACAPSMAPTGRWFGGRRQPGGRATSSVHVLIDKVAVHKVLLVELHAAVGAGRARRRRLVPRGGHVPLHILHALRAGSHLRLFRHRTDAISQPHIQACIRMVTLKFCQDAFSPSEHRTPQPGVLTLQYVRIPSLFQSTGPHSPP